MRPRIAVFGGSFDPVHRGHLAVADAVQAQLEPERLLWVPARLAPHKPDAAPAAGEHRAGLIELALAGRPGEQLCRWELEREGPSYTVDTLERLHGERPEARLFLVLGGDSQQHWRSWRRLERILELAEPVWFPRRGWEGLQAGMPGRMLAMPLVDLAATELRRCLRAGEDPGDALPPAVAARIAELGLYQS